MADSKNTNKNSDDISQGNEFIVRQMQKRGIVPGKAPRTQMAKPKKGDTTKKK